MFGKILYDEPKPVAMFVTLMGASTEIDDDGKITQHLSVARWYMSASLTKNAHIQMA